MRLDSRRCARDARSPALAPTHRHARGRLASALRARAAAGKSSSALSRALDVFGEARRSGRARPTMALPPRRRVERAATFSLDRGGILADKRGNSEVL